MDQRLVASLAVREWGDPDQPAVLMWPGLGSTGAYFQSLAEALPCRALAVDPPGIGGSASVDPGTYERLVEMACAVVDSHDCRAIVGHSLGAYVAAGVAATRPACLAAAVLIDGGFLEAEEMGQIGIPVTAGRTQLVEWLTANELQFADWDETTRELAAMISARETPAFEAYVREVFEELDGQVRERGAPDRAADLLLATFDHDVRGVAEKLAIPTLLIACGQPEEQRDVRESAWQAFASRSSLVELHVADGWGHNPIFQDPEGFSTLVADWLDGHVEAPRR